MTTCESNPNANNTGNLFTQFSFPINWGENKTFMHFTIDRIDTTMMISLDLSFKFRYYRRIYRELFGEEYQSDCEEDDSLSASDSSDDKEDTQNDPEKAP